MSEQQLIDFYTAMVPAATANCEFAVGLAGTIVIASILLCALMIVISMFACRWSEGRQATIAFCVFVGFISFLVFNTERKEKNILQKATSAWVQKKVAQAIHMGLQQ